MFVPPCFEPNSIVEPQWFPRPITDSIESNLDLLERLEEDRKRRLRSIANVAARTPIGLGGVEDRGHAGSASNVSPKPAGGGGGAGGSNNYSRYRYYPPTSEVSASLHTSYQQQDHLFGRSTTPASVTTRRDRHYRRGTTPRQQQQQQSSSTDATSSSRDGARTPVDGYGNTATTPAAGDRAYMHNSSFRSTSNASTFMLSPPLDPRAGGGYNSSSMRSPSINMAPHTIQRHPARRGGTYYQRQSIESSAGVSSSSSFNMNINTTATPTAGEEEFVTPPNAIATADQTSGHGVGDDVYSQRRVASQARRRRRGWDEVNI